MTTPKEKLRKEGYHIFRGVFQQDQIDHLRDACSKAGHGDTLAQSCFNGVSLSSEMMKVLGEVFDEPIIYPCLSQNRWNDNPKKVGSRYFHVDSIPDDGNYEEEYGIYNVGIYLQDHKNFGGGLKMRPGSHKVPCESMKSVQEWSRLLFKSLLRLDLARVKRLLIPPRSINLDTSPGDVIIWNTRTHHSGYFVKLKLFKNLSLPAIVENWVPRFMRIDNPQKRAVLLSIYCKQTKYVEDYIANQIRKEYRSDYYFANKELENQEKVNFAKERGIIIRNDGYLYQSKLREFQTEVKDRYLS